MARVFLSKHGFDQFSVIFFPTDDGKSYNIRAEVSLWPGTEGDGAGGFPCDGEQGLMSRTLLFWDCCSSVCDRSLSASVFKGKSSKTQYFLCQQIIPGVLMFCLCVIAHELKHIDESDFRNLKSKYLFVCCLVFLVLGGIIPLILSQDLVMLTHCDVKCAWSSFCLVFGLEF